MSVSSRVINENGNVYGKLTVVAAGLPDKQKNARWVCLCECGKTDVIMGGYLRSGRRRSCASCSKNELADVNIIENDPAVLLLDYAKSVGDWFPVSDFNEYVGRVRNHQTAYGYSSRLVKAGKLESKKIKLNGRRVHHYRFVTQRDVEKESLPNGKTRTMKEGSALFLDYAKSVGDWFPVSDFNEYMGMDRSAAISYGYAKVLIEDGEIETKRLRVGNRRINHYRKTESQDIEKDDVAKSEKTKESKLTKYVKEKIATIYNGSTSEQTPEQVAYERGREDMALFFAQKFLDEQAAQGK